MRESGRMDGVLLTFVLVLCLAGVLFVYSSSVILAQTEHKPDTAYLSSQVEKLVLGLILLAVCAKWQHRLLRGRIAWLCLGVSTFLLILLLVPVGLSVEVRHTRRFLNLGVMQIQPAEFARLALIVFLAEYLSRKEDRIRESWKSLIVPLGAILATAGLTVLQPNLSSAVLIGAIGFALLYLGGHPLKRLLVVAGPLAVVVLLTMKAYQLTRIRHLTHHFEGVDSSLPYQVKQSLIALGSGGFFGRGIGQGLQKFHYLPFPHTDFILGIVGEETGFLGILALFTCFGVLILRGLRIARTAPDRFSELLALGLTLSVALNFILHSVVGLGIGPVTGVPLPFVSHGGSSLLMNLMAMGILLSISRHTRPALEVSPAWKAPGGSLRVQ